MGAPAGHLINKSLSTYQQCLCPPAALSWRGERPGQHAASHLGDSETDLQARQGVYVYACAHVCVY